MRRLVAAVLIAGIATCIFPTPFSALPAEALPGLPSPCDLAPTPALKDACELANPATVVGAVAGVANDAAGGVPGAIAGNIFDAGLAWLNGVLADTVKGALDGLGEALANAPKAPLESASFTNLYGQLMAVGLALCFFLFGFHVFAAPIRGRSPTRPFGFFVLAVFLTAAAPFIIGGLLVFADSLSAAFASMGGQEAGQLVDKLADVSNTITVNGGLDAVKPLILIMVLLVAVALVLFWMLLLTVRSELIYLGTLAAPFIIPSVVDGKARFAKVYAAAMFGVVISAPILLGVVCAGSILLRDGYVGADGLWPLLTGVGLILLATFLPFAVLKAIVPLAAPAVVAVERAGGRVIHSVGSVGSIVAGAVTGGAAGAAVASTAPDPTPPPRPSWPTAPDPPTPAVAPDPAPTTTTTTTGFPWTTTPSSNGHSHESEPEPSHSA
jgi:hypothetical protein